MGVTHHDGVSVYGSGLWWGKKTNLSTFPGEQPFFGGRVGSSGLLGTGAIRFDGGTVGVSGQILSISTRLSSIYWACATLNALPTSGLNGVVAVTSGNSNFVDLDTIHATGSGTVALASVSTPVSWIVGGF